MSTLIAALAASLFGCSGGTRPAGPEPDGGALLESLHHDGGAPGWAMSWVVQAGGPNYDPGVATAALGDGSALVTGEFFYSPVVFGEGTPEETWVDCAGGADLFLARYGPSGALEWVATAGGQVDDYSQSLDTLADGDFLLAGWFGSEAVFGAGQENETTLVPADNRDAFLARYRADGSLEWVTSAGGPGADKAKRIAALADGSSLVVGHFEETAVFGAGEEHETELASEGEEDAFVARFGPGGALVWARRAGGAGRDGAGGVAALADGSVIVSGKFTGQAVFGAGQVNETALDAAGVESVFFARYGESGELLWARDLGVDGDEVAGSSSATGAVALKNGGFALTGGFEGSLTCETDDGSQTVVAHEGKRAFFLSRHRDDGSIEWIASANGPGFWHRASTVDELAGGSIAVSGRYSGETVFGAGEPNETTLFPPSEWSPNNREGFVALYKHDGTLEWAIGQNGWGSTASLGLSARDDQTIYVTGWFGDETVFGTGPADAVTLTSHGDGDMFLMRLDRIGQPD